MRWTCRARITGTPERHLPGPAVSGHLPPSQALSFLWVPDINRSHLFLCKNILSFTHSHQLHLPLPVQAAPPPTSHPSLGCSRSRAEATIQRHLLSHTHCPNPTPFCGRPGLTPAHLPPALQGPLSNPPRSRSRAGGSCRRKPDPMLSSALSPNPGTVSADARAGHSPDSGHPRAIQDRHSHGTHGGLCYDCMGSRSRLCRPRGQSQETWATAALSESVSQAPT